MSGGACRSSTEQDNFRGKLGAKQEEDDKDAIFGLPGNVSNLIKKGTWACLALLVAAEALPALPPTLPPTVPLVPVSARRAPATLRESAESLMTSRQKASRVSRSHFRQ